MKKTISDSYAVDPEKLGVFIAKKMKEQGLSTRQVAGTFMNPRTLQKIMYSNNVLPNIETLMHIANALHIELLDMIFSSQYEEYGSVIVNYRRILHDISTNQYDSNQKRDLLLMLKNLYNVKLTYNDSLIVLMILSFLGEKRVEFHNFIENEYIKNVKIVGELEEHVISVYLYKNENAGEFIEIIKKHELLSKNSRIIYYICSYYAQSKEWESLLDVYNSFYIVQPKFEVSTDFTAELQCYAGIAHFNIGNVEKGSVLLEQGLVILDYFKKNNNIIYLLNFAEKNNINVNYLKKLYCE